MPKEYKYIDGALWKCCVSQRDRTCSKCGGPILKGQYYFYFRQDRDDWQEYRCHSCATPGVKKHLKLEQTTIELPWKPADRGTVNTQVTISAGEPDPAGLQISLSGNSITMKEVPSKEFALMPHLQKILAKGIKRSPTFKETITGRW